MSGAELVGVTWYRPAEQLPRDGQEVLFITDRVVYPGHFQAHGGGVWLTHRRQHGLENEQVSHWAYFPPLPVALL